MLKSLKRKVARVEKISISKSGLEYVSKVRLRRLAGRKESETIWINWAYWLDKWVLELLEETTTS